MKVSFPLVDTHILHAYVVYTGTVCAHECTVYVPRKVESTNVEVRQKTSMDKMGKSKKNKSLLMLKI